MTGYMSLDEARKTARDTEMLAKLIDVPYEGWAKNCHSISLKLLKTGMFGPGRIARGWAQGVTGQHSWIVLGDDVYARQAVIVDPTWIFYLQEKSLAGSRKGIQADYAFRLTHSPHGHGSIWSYGRPGDPSGEIIELTPSFELSREAKLFLSDDVLGPLDRQGWQQLASGAMEEWPAGEIIAAMDDTPELAALVPIDILGMLTPRNPGGLYLPDAEPELPDGPALRDLWRDSWLFRAGIVLAVVAVLLIMARFANIKVY
jgi:hypothetical protein